MRCLLLLPCAAWIAACYSPNDDVVASNGDDGGSSSAEDSTGSSVSASSTVTTPADTSGDPSADTASTEPDPTADTGEDAPPVIEEFSVQGSQAPPEISAAETVVLAADVSDDLGVARVEFYDEGSLIATVDAAPWETEFLVTSADNGGHSYTAIAYDTSDQTADAGPIPLSVNIEGGAVLELREEIFRSRSYVGVLFTPSVSVSESGDVIVFGSSLFSGQSFHGSRWTALKYSDNLSQLWLREFPTQVSAGTPDHWSISAPIERGDQTLVVEYTDAGGVPDTNTVHRLNSASGAMGSDYELTFGPLDELPPRRSLAVDAEDNLVLLSVGGDLQKLDADGEILWQQNVVTGLPAGTYPIRLALDVDGNALVDIACSSASCSDTSLRKYSPDGDLQWTRDNGGASQPLPDGSVVTVGVWFDEELTILHRDANGTELSANELEIEPLGVLDIALTPAGDVVFVGMRQVGVPLAPEAWAVRTSASGEVGWLTKLEVGDEGRTTASGVAISNDGRVYVSGTADDEADSVFLVTQADAWVAELAL